MRCEDHLLDVSMIGSIREKVKIDWFWESQPRSLALLVTRFGWNGTIMRTLLPRLRIFITVNVTVPVPVKGSLADAFTGIQSITSLLTAQMEA